MRKLFSLLLLAVVVSTAGAFEFNRQSAGLIKGARQSYVSGTAIKVGVGYGEIMGSYWEITPTDPLVTTGYTLTGLTTTANGVVQYLYIDRANSSLPDVTLKNSATAPTWSDDFMGWYNGTDRCIGALWVEPSGVLRSFLCPQDDTYEMSFTLFSKPLPATIENWTYTDVAAYLPVNARETRCLAEIWYSSVNWFTCHAAVSWVFADGVVRARAMEWVSFPRGTAKTLPWNVYAQTSSGAISTTGNAQIGVGSYRIER